MDLRDKSIILVGASTGIGRALALELAREGARLFLVARRGALLEEVAGEIRRLGGTARAFAADTTDPAQVRAAFEACGEPDGLVFNAGTSAVTMLGRYSSAEVKRVLEANFYGFLYWLDHFLPVLRRRRNGFVAATTALCAYRGIPSAEAYAASKGALGNFLEGLRLDLAPLGIPVFQIMPGFVKSPMSDLNNMSSPFLISAEEAARTIARSFRKDRTRIELSTGMSWTMRLLRTLPDRLYYRVFRDRWILPRQQLEQLLERLPPFLCPADGAVMTFDGYASFVCPGCGARITMERDHLDLLHGNGNGHGTSREEQVKLAYRFYSLIYPVAAFLAMKCVWRGTLRHLLTFYRDRVAEAAAEGRPFLDVATGDGSLTKIALKKLPVKPDFLSVDLSRDMLRKASKKFRTYPGKLFYVCDVGQLNMPDESFSHVLCFGGLHCFPDVRGGLTRMRRLIKRGGQLSGSYLLRPGTPRRDRLVDWGIEKGLLSNSLTEDGLRGLFEEAGFQVRRWELNGRMLLFSLGRNG